MGIYSSGTIWRAPIYQEDSERPAQLITAAMEKLSAEALRRLWHTSKRLEHRSWELEVRGISLATLSSKLQAGFH
ncbi:hypothetical protein PHISCL_05126 [Aspergillus sclerotialis]|uniref:Uncharacterized protein n=1 Tax=Aspergillus sclerotialis TaxID=2070753 RepID=A0A3A2ZJ26_9EURO|nr:hypothetical protein PHISCL_05126 [Aspergillus sclerotialis]